MVYFTSLPKKVADILCASSQLGEIPGAHDHAAVQVTADQQFLDEQTGHDRLAGAGVIRQEKAERLPPQHLALDGGDLMRQRVHHRGVDGEKRVKQMEPVVRSRARPRG